MNIRADILRGRVSGTVDAVVLGAHPILAGMPTEALNHLAAAARWHVFGVRGAISTPGDEYRGVFLVATGRARLTLTLWERELSVLQFGPGSAINLADWPPLLDEVASVAAERDGTIVYRVQPTAFERAVSSHAQPLKRLMDQERECVLKLLGEAFDRHFGDRTLRVGHALGLAALDNEKHTVWLTHREVAERCGLSREEVTRTLPRLEGWGLIKRERRKTGIKVLDVDRIMTDFRPAPSLPR